MGILVFPSKAPRLPGDGGNAQTFSYPVCFEAVEGSFFRLLSRDTEMRDNLLNACYHLKEQGVSAIIGDCGLMSLYQQEMPGACGLPVAASSLVLLPLIWQLMGRQGTIGILTGHSAYLTQEHLRSSGWDEGIQIEIEGMERQPHFSEIVLEGGEALDERRMRVDVLRAVGALLKRKGDIRAILLECSNLPTYARDIAETFHIPVFDIVGLADLLRRAVEPMGFG